MSEKPIIFSGESVRAILDGRKTMTRRVMKVQPSAEFSPSLCQTYEPMAYDKNGEGYPGAPIFGCYDLNGQNEGYKCPGAIGDRWVRESFYAYGKYRFTGKKTPKGKPEVEFWDCTLGANGSYRYAADETLPKPDSRYEFGWHCRPSIFMPRIASRITLEITDIKVERLQDISEEDAKAEGFDLETCAGFFRQAAGKVCLSDDCYWLEHEETGEEDDGDTGYYCRPCAEAQLKKLGDKWFLRYSNCPEADGPAYCGCGTPLLMSLTKYGIERELLMETFNEGPTGSDPPRYPVKGMDASIAEMIADGYGDLQEQHHGRLAQIGFATAWNLMNGKKFPWVSNPWAWCISFKKI